MISLLRSTFDILPKRLIFLGAEKVLVFQWLKGEITHSYIMDTNENGRIQFERYLSESEVDDTYVLIDVTEEEFRMETIPHVFGSDRTALLTRKKERLFRNTNYFYSEMQGRETEGRRDDIVLMSSMGESGLLRPWLELLEKYKFPVVAVSSVALFSKNILEYLPNRTDKTLLVTMQSISGLRQSFFDGEDLKISRMVKMPRFGTTPYAPIISSEIEKIQRYLNSLRLVSNQEQLTVYFLTEGELLKELKTKLVDTETIQYKLIDLNYMAKISGAGFALRTPFSDKLFVHHAFKKKVKNAYGNPDEIRYSTMRRFRHAMYAASLVLLIGGSLLSGWFLMNAVSFKQDSMAAVKKTEFYTERFQIAREGLPKTPIEPNEIKTVVEIAENLNKYKTKPEPILKVISAALNNYPELMLDGLKWTHSTDPNYDPDSVTTGNMNRVANPVQSQSGNLYYQIATLDARLANFNGNFRSAINTVNKFAEELRGKEFVENVTVVSFPVDISSEASMQGNVNKTSKEALFSLRIALGVPDASEK